MAMVVVVVRVVVVAVADMVDRWVGAADGRERVRWQMDECAGKFTREKIDGHTSQHTWLPGGGGDEGSYAGGDGADGDEG